MTEEEFVEYSENKQLTRKEELKEFLNVEEILDDDLNDADNEGFSGDDEEDEEEDDSFYENIELKPDHAIVDRSFTNLGYIGFGEGINFETLDQTKNWQFDEYLK